MTEKRNWKEYNEHLVQRGEILIAIESLSGWQEELKKMNGGKKGRPFLYPDSLILFLGILRMVFSIPYRQLEGVARGLSKLILLPVPDYTTLSLRLPKIDIDPNLGRRLSEGEGLVIAVDSTGIKVTKRGEWMRGRRKGNIKVHVAVDVRTKEVVSIEVSDERTSDGRMLKPLVQEGIKEGEVERVLGGDGGYDSEENFRFLSSRGIEAGIRVRKNSREESKGERGKVVRAYLQDPKGWKERVGYGKRWVAESFFSAFKRLFGELVMAKRIERMVKEIKMKVWIYNMMVGLGRALGFAHCAG